MVPIELTSILTGNSVFIYPTSLIALETTTADLDFPDGTKDKVACTFVLIAGAAYYVSETPKQIFHMVDEVKRKAEERLIRLNRNLRREDWQEGEE